MLRDWRILVLSFSVLSLFLAFPGAVFAQQTAQQVSAEDYQVYMDWINGQEDPRLDKETEKVKKRKIAKQIGVSVKILEAAIEKVEPYASTIVKTTEDAIKAALKGTPIGAKVQKVVIDAREGHVVGYVNWACGDRRDWEKEAAFAAWATAEAGTIVKTLGVWCVNEKGTKMFSAKIGRGAFSRIRKAQIERFALSRYIRLFEGVKRGPHR
ncbi:hypothetical protein KAI87_13405 [Myxococcota bacterium]|nr:hypothetical protein [Myxococcota bacterium]